MLRVSNSYIKKQKGAGPKGWGNLENDFGRLDKLFPKQDIRRPYERSADLGITAAGGGADQARNDFMAQGGSRFGAGGQLMAGAARHDMMRPARADAAQLRAQGTQAQAASDMERMGMINGILAQIMQTRSQEKMQREQIAAQKWAEGAKMREELAKRSARQASWGPYGGVGQAGYTSGLATQMQRLGYLPPGY